MREVSTNAESMQAGSRRFDAPGAIAQVSAQRRRTGAITLTVVGGPHHAVDVFALLISIAALIGTALQMLVALVEAREAHRPALQVANAEHELAHEVPLWRRRKVRRELRSWRDAETEKSLAYVDVVLLSWTLLAFASGAATIQTLAAL